MTSGAQAATPQVAEMMQALGRDARRAAASLARMDGAARDAGLAAAVNEIRANAATILAANARDMKDGEGRGLGAAMLDRLMLDEARI